MGKCAQLKYFVFFHPKIYICFNFLSSFGKDGSLIGVEMLSVDTMWGKYLRHSLLWHRQRCVLPLITLRICALFVFQPIICLHSVTFVFSINVCSTHALISLLIVEGYRVLMLYGNAIVCHRSKWVAISFCQPRHRKKRKTLATSNVKITHTRSAVICSSCPSVNEYIW